MTDGQLAHLTRKPTSRVTEDDVAYLCLECHKDFDLKSNRIRPYTPTEVRCYRDELYAKIGSNQVTLEFRLVVTCDYRKEEAIRQAVFAVHRQALDLAQHVDFSENRRAPKNG